MSKRFVFDPTKCKEWRERRCLTQKELAVLLGMHEQWGADSLCKWEGGFRAPSAKHMRELAAALDCKLEQLMSTEDEAQENWRLYQEWLAAQAAGRQLRAERKQKTLQKRRANA